MVSYELNSSTSGNVVFTQGHRLRCGTHNPHEEVWLRDGYLIAILQRSSKQRRFMAVVYPESFAKALVIPQIVPLIDLLLATVSVVSLYSIMKAQSVVWWTGEEIRYIIGGKTLTQDGRYTHKLVRTRHNGETTDNITPPITLFSIMQ